MEQIISFTDLNDVSSIRTTTKDAINYIIEPFYHECVLYSSHQHFKQYSFLQKYNEMMEKVSSVIKLSGNIVKHIRDFSSNNFKSNESMLSNKELGRSLNEYTSLLYKSYISQNKSINVSEKEAIVFAFLNDQGSISSPQNVSRKDLPDITSKTANEKNEFLNELNSQRNPEIKNSDPEMSNINDINISIEENEFSEHKPFENIIFNPQQKFHTKFEVNKRLVEEIQKPEKENFKPSKLNIDRIGDSLVNVLDILNVRKDSNKSLDWNDDAIMHISLSSVEADFSVIQSKCKDQSTKVTLPAIPVEPYVNTLDMYKNKC